MNEYIPKEGYFYIVQEREFLGTNNYKIGRTSDVEDRLRGYSKNSKLIYSIKVDDQNEVESMLIEIFKDKFIQKREYGREYFEGDINEMIQEVELYIQFKNKYGKYITHSITIMLKKIINVKSKNKKNNENKVLKNKVLKNKVLKNTVIENTVIENTVAENTVLENTVIEYKVLENTVVENKVVENTVEENIVIENIVEENTVIENIVEENTVIENIVEENTFIENKDLENMDLENKELENTVIENKQLENKELKNELLENKELENNKIKNKKLESFDYYYDCKRCFYKSVIPSEIKRHLERQIKCKPHKNYIILSEDELLKQSLEKQYKNIDELYIKYLENKKINEKEIDKCEYCFERFSTEQSLNRHLKICKILKIVEKKLYEKA